ncbi:MAG: Na+/H+ antiporter subunit E [candidate division WOR-3 bacterium]
MKKKFAQFIIYFIMWVLLTWSLKLQDIMAGVLVALFITILTRKLFPEDIIKLLQPKRFFFALLYIPYLVYYIILANFDVAYRVLNPSLPINPGIVKVKTKLKNEFAKVILANSITLTPGTLTVEVDGENFYVHWINIISDDPEVQREIILGRFERMLRRIFE